MNIMELMKQIQRIKANLEDMKEDIKSREFVGEAGGGMVRVIINGSLEVVSVEIDDSIIKDKETLEILVKSAINDALEKFRESSESIFKSLFSL